MKARGMMSTYEKGIGWATSDDEEQIQRGAMEMHAHKRAQARKGEDPIAHQERRIPPVALSPVLQQIKGWLRQGVMGKCN